MIAARNQAGRDTAASAFVARLTLTEFRCYSYARIDTGPGAIVLTGQDYAGKTNLLEAISLLSPGRAPTQRAVGRFPAHRRQSRRGLGVAATIAGPDGEMLVGTGRDPGSERRIIQIDGKLGQKARRRWRKACRSSG